MEDWEKEMYLLHAKSQRFKKRINEAKEIIDNILPSLNNPYVAFSCGKDSSVLAHLVLNARPRTILRFLSSGETRLVHNVDDVLNWFSKYGGIIDEILIDRVFSEEWQDATWTEQRKAGRRDMDLLNKGDWDGILMGLRIEESNPRKMSLIMHQDDDLPRYCHKYKNGQRKDMIRICPLANWHKQDIGAYLFMHKIPYLRHYENHGFEARTTARLTGDAVRQYVLSDIKRDNPQNWIKLTKRFPEFRAFV
jgi:sulfate adenylyltransferase subunit 2